MGKPIDHVPSTFDRDVVSILLITHLGIPTEEEAMAMTTIGGRMRSMWLAELYHRYVELGSRVWTIMISSALGQQYDICQQVLDSHPCRLPPLPQQP